MAKGHSYNQYTHNFISRWSTHILTLNIILYRTFLNRTLWYRTYSYRKHTIWEWLPGAPISRVHGRCWVGSSSGRMATFYNTRHAIAMEVWGYCHCRNKYRYPGGVGLRKTKNAYIERSLQSHSQNAINLFANTVYKRPTAWWEPRQTFQIVQKL